MNDNPIPEGPRTLSVQFTWTNPQDEVRTDCIRCHIVELHCAEMAVTVMFYNLKPTSGGYTKHLLAVRTNVVSVDTVELSETEQVVN